MTSNMKRSCSKATRGNRVRSWSFLLAGLGLVLAGGWTGVWAAAPPEIHRHHGAHGGDGEAGRESPAVAAAPTKGLHIPDVRLVNQAGEEVRFYSDLVQGRVVALNFIFTTCTTICPPMGANFARLQEILGERVGKDVQLISVSVDPVTDTPQRLRAWGERFGAGPGWTLLTGSKPEVERLLKSLAVFTPDYNDHSPVVLIGHEGHGEWRRVYGLAPAAKLAELVAELAGGGEGR